MFEWISIAESRRAIEDRLSEYIATSPCVPARISQSQTHTEDTLAYMHHPVSPKKMENINQDEEL